MLTDEQLHRICVKPELPEDNLGTLPDTYRWAGVLRGGRKHMAVAARVLGLEFTPGAIFTGPEGNGRHTTAYALARTLCADRDGYRSLISIHGDDLDFEDREDIYAVVERVTKVAKVSTALVLIVDQPGLSRHNLLLQRLLLRVQAALLRENLRLYLIVITEKAEDISPELMSRFPRYHCAPPDDKAVKKWASRILKEPVPLKIAGTTASDLAAAARGLSWKQLKDLHQNLLRLTVLQYAMNKKAFDAKGLTEEDVYRGGKITLDKSVIAGILESTAHQRTVAAPVAAYTGMPMMPMMKANPSYAFADSLDPAVSAEEDQVPETMEVSEFTRFVESMRHLTVEDDGS